MVAISWRFLYLPRFISSCTHAHTRSRTRTQGLETRRESEASRVEKCDIPWQMDDGDSWQRSTFKRDCLFRARLPANTNLRYFVASTAVCLSSSDFPFISLFFSLFLYLPLSLPLCVDVPPFLSTNQGADGINAWSIDEIIFQILLAVGDARLASGGGRESRSSPMVR